MRGFPGTSGEKDGWKENKKILLEVDARIADCNACDLIQIFLMCHFASWLVCLRFWSYLRTSFRVLHSVEIKFINQHHNHYPYILYHCYHYCITIIIIIITTTNTTTTILATTITITFKLTTLPLQQSLA